MDCSRQQELKWKPANLGNTCNYSNDAERIPTFDELLDLNHDFEKEKVISYNLISNLSPETPQKCGEKINSMILQ